ncbi:MAG: electron transport complex subunit RsxC [Clostridia bacterium]|nr:electron transport complex subunit RsxC [Clostridia bacterium]
MAFSLHGVRTPHRKHTVGQQVFRLPVPKTVTLPTVMHIGKPATPVVKVGDHVDVGTLIAEQNGPISSPVYASVSGKITKISDLTLSGGTKAPAITIESDGAMTTADTVVPPVIDSAEDLVEAIRMSGIVGLGGAGFPTYVKFKTDFSKIQELVVNGAECEPYITSDSVTMTERSEEMAVAFRAMERHFGIRKIVIGIENNKPAAVASMRKLAEADSCISIRVLPAKYPQGGEKVLVYHTTGKIIPEGKLPADVGCIVCNCTTVAAIGNYLMTGMPLVEKCVTVDGAMVRKPGNVWVPIGTALSAVFEACGGLKGDPAKVLYGGPMMGLTVPDLSVPILKNTNAILALSDKEAKLPPTTACIRCGACTNHCPFGINPAAIALAYAKKDGEALSKLGVNLCMSCGSCSFGCPANRPLVQTNQLAKIFLREEKAKENK